MRDDAGHVPSPVLEGEPPRQSDEVHKDHAQVDVDFYPPIPVEGLAPIILPQPNLPAQPIFLSIKGPPPAAEERRKLDLIEERLRVVEGFGDYPFVDMIFAWYRMSSSPKNSRYLISTNTKG